MSLQPKVLGRSRLTRQQRGQALLEWLIVATLALLVAIWGSEKWAARAEQAALEGMGQWLLTLSQAMQKAIETEAQESGSVMALLTQKPPASAQAWQQTLTTTGFLVSGFAAQPPLPFEVKVHRLDTGRDCADAACPTALILLAVAPKDWSVSRRQHAAPDLLLALKGQGLAVTALNPDRLQGSSFAVDSNWPLGTVAVLVWRSEVLPPYVRLREDRPVHLAGGLVVDGAVAVNGQLALSEGLLLGDSANLKAACAPDGLLLRSPKQQLLMCRESRWRAVQPPSPRETTACLPRKPEHILMPMWRASLIAPLLPPPDSRPCICPSHYMPRAVWQGSGSIAGTAITNGYICEKG